MRTFERKQVTIKIDGSSSSSGSRSIEAAFAFAAAPPGVRAAVASAHFIQSIFEQVNQAEAIKRMGSCCCVLFSLLLLFVSSSTSYSLFHSSSSKQHCTRISATISLIIVRAFLILFAPLFFIFSSFSFSSTSPFSSIYHIYLSLYYYQSALPLFLCLVPKSLTTIRRSHQYI